MGLEGFAHLKKSIAVAARLFVWLLMCSDAYERVEAGCYGCDLRFAVFGAAKDDAVVGALAAWGRAADDLPITC